MMALFSVRSPFTSGTGEAGLVAQEVAGGAAGDFAVRILNTNVIATAETVNKGEDAAASHGTVYRHAQEQASVCQGL